MKAFETEMQRLTLHLALWELIAFVAGMVVLYFVIKLAIREGIRESGLLDALSRRRPDDRTVWANTTKELPDMRAER